MLDFLSENYVWLIVIGVFILMIIIGYFADKNQNKEKKPKLKDHVDELDNQENETNDVKIDEWEETPVPKEEDEIIEVKGLDNSFDSWDDNMEGANETSAEESVNEDNATDESEANEESSEVVESAVDESSDIEEPAIKDNSEMVESAIDEPSETEEPITDTVESAEEKPIEEANPIEDLEITLPNIDTLNEEIKDVVDAEDVWKF